MSKLFVKTRSGAEYIITQDGIVSGGSKDLKQGKLINAPVEINKPLLMITPERKEQNPNAVLPGVVSTPVVHISLVNE